MFRVSHVRANGAIEALDIGDEDKALRYWNSLCNSDNVYAGFFELGFPNTTDAQWIIVNQYWRDAG